ncbi:alpha/beta fold hydrolase [Rhodococcus sp. IEGM 1379]|uniref:esterase/lipase family protein n=1 Tax=Rhodococcus sp. IEGM 1379 TaxID=3047086 RepID=UPI0024B736FB|nr:alpha/beta fold hydrolase [Rhodococcus sp. IEGM 1379]MDI9918418.1 alpha/beta fold hydrolase [Rhodococcus sp. IEGM 1379]
MTVVTRSAGLVFSVVTALAVAVPSVAGAVTPTLVGPAQTTRHAATGYAEAHPDVAPAGSNNFGCKSSAAHPRPVLLAHGTDTQAYADWAAVAPALAADGYCVFALNYGKDPEKDTYGVGDIVSSASEFSTFVDQVRSATGADRVDVVGYSQGATVTRYYINKLGGSLFVDQWIGLASPTYGGVMFGLVPIIRAIPGGDEFVEDTFSVAVREQMEGSDLLRSLNDGGDTVPGVRYTTIGSRVDEMIQPSSNIALQGPGAENIVLQDLCPQNLTGHFRMPYDPYVIDIIRTSLDPNAERHASCTAVPLGADIPQVVIDANS